MIFLQLFYTFLKIGIFTFGGGYAMIPLIQNEVVYVHGWMTAQEFTDILAISQMTPGPIGINTATYAGYTSVVNVGMAQWMGCIGAVLASGAVLLLPVLLMIVVTRFLQRNSQNPYVQSMMGAMKLTAIGLIAAAALLLFSKESFGEMGWNRQFVSSVVIFAVVFGLSVMPRSVAFSAFGRAVTVKRPSPILMLLACALAGLLLYGV